MMCPITDEVYGGLRNLFAEQLCRVKIMGIIIDHPLIANDRPLKKQLGPGQYFTNIGCALSGAVNVEIKGDDSRGSVSFPSLNYPHPLLAGDAGPQAQLRIELKALDIFT
jgi:hypothetical protein